MYREIWECDYLASNLQVPPRPHTSTHTPVSVAALSFKAAVLLFCSYMYISYASIRLKHFDIEWFREMQLLS